MSKQRLSILIWTFIVLALAACAGSPSPTPGVVTVDILFLNHPPVRDVLTQVDPVLAAYGDKVSVTRYDVDTPEGAAFAKQKGLTGHVPLAIFVNGVPTFDVNGRKVTFESFPQGAGTGMVPDGAWAVADLDSVLQSLVKK
jgi:hypothetical protein